MSRPTQFDEKWNQLILALFPSHVPDSAEWTRFEDIFGVLKKICDLPDVHDMFLPGSFGRSLQAVKKANESKCLELNLDGALHVLQPRSLQFVGFSLDRQACHFRLWNMKLSPIYDHDSLSENLIAFKNGSHRQHKCELDFDEGPGNGPAKMDDNELAAVLAAKEGKKVYRWDKEVSFVIFSKGSLYSKTFGIYGAP